MKLFVLDNGGETFDRYTIINEKDGEMIGASDDPFHPMGFAQHCGNAAQNHFGTSHWDMAFGEKVGKRVYNRLVKQALNAFKKDCEHIGKPISFDSLPEDVKKFALQCFDNN
jgi:hypothetical protein